VTTYREAIRTALAVHRSYRELHACYFYDVPPQPCADVPSLTYWYGTDPAVHVFDEALGDYVITDRRTYRALTVLLAVAPIGGRAVLGIPVRSFVAASVLTVAIGGAIGAAIPAPCFGDDGYRCVSEAEYADVLARLDVIRSERSGDRFDGGR